MVTHVQKELNASKISHIWEEPYVTTEAYDIGYFRIPYPDLVSINAKWLSYIIFRNTKIGEGKRKRRVNRIDHRMYLYSKD